MSFPDQDAGTLTNIPIGFLHENSMRRGESDVTLGVSSVPCLAWSADGGEERNFEFKMESSFLSEKVGSPPNFLF